jgi:hypothetical protein
MASLLKMKVTGFRVQGSGKKEYGDGVFPEP